PSNRHSIDETATVAGPGLKRIASRDLRSICRVRRGSGVRVEVLLLTSTVMLPIAHASEELTHPREQTALVPGRVGRRAIALTLRDPCLFRASACARRLRGG